MKNHFSSRINRLVIALTGVLLMSVGSAYAGTGYTHGRAFLKQGSPTAAGKVYVAANATEPSDSQYKDVTSPTSPAFDVKNASTQTYHFWAKAKPGYIFTGWYTYEGALVSSGAAHISKSVTQPQAGTSDTHAYADYYASFIKQIQLSFIAPTNGSFDINHNGSTVTPAYSSFTTEGRVVLTAHPDDGYKLRGWYTSTNGGVTKNYFAFGNTCEPNFTANTTIGAEFVPDDGKATFWIKGTNKIFNDLNDANTAASSGNIIVVVSDGVVGAGTYSIKSGVTLLIPYNETYNLMTTPNVVHYTSAASAPALSIFRKLTLAAGATINVSGNICIGGSQAGVNGGNPSSFPCGPCGVLDLSRGGTVNLASGAILYAWGFVKGQDMDQGNNTTESGVGVINAASGAIVWEDYQVGEWRGGSASETIYNNKGSWKFFPFQSYTIQNIEAPVNYAYGSTLKCYWAIFGNGTTYTVPFALISTASGGSLFNLTASGASVKKWYDPTTDRVCFELGGKATLDALTLSVMGESVSTSDYNLPIPANLQINLASGTNLTVAKPMTVHAGAVVEIKSGATLKLNSNVYLYDKDDWDMYCMYKYYYRTYKNLTIHYDRGTGQTKDILEDATMIVDGTLDLTGSGRLYATQHGANVCGNGGGQVKYGTLPGNTTMTQCKELKDNVSVNIRSVNLHNDNETYTKGIASTTFKNVHGRWFTSAKATEKANHTYDFTYIKSGDVYGTGGTNGTVSSCWSKDKTGLELQDKWANIKAQGCTNWWQGIDDTHLYNWSLNSAWHQYIKAGTITSGTGEEAVTTDIYAGSDGKLIYKTDCEFVNAGTIDGNCLYTVDEVKKALVNGSFVAVTANASPDHGYHATADASAYYLCFDGCVWHPATRNAENRYTVDGTVYIWYGDQWLAVQYDSTVSLYYSLSSTNVKIFYEYVDHAWVLATPVAEVVTSAGTEQVFSLTTAITKAKAGGTNVTIRLLKNLSGTITYDGANNCSLDLNGFTLSSSTNNMITVNHASATFIVKDQSAAGTGKVQLSYSANSRRYAVSVTKGHFILNSGTVSAINTMAYTTDTKTVDVGGVTIASGYKFTMNGGRLEAISDHNPYGVNIASSSTSVVTINGGTIEAKTTERSSSVDSPYAIYGYGKIVVNGGTIKATCYRSSSSRGITVLGTLEMYGGEVIATGTGTIYGLHVGTSSLTTPTATITDGTIKATAATGGTTRAILSYANTTVSGGNLIAKSTTSDARGIYVLNGTTTINAGVVVNDTATSNSYGLYYGGGTVTVNGGRFNAATSSSTGAYGVYAEKGTGTINDGDFFVTAKTTEAYGLYVPTANTPQCFVNGGKFMVKTSNGSAAGTINNTGATLANFAMAGGYYNVAPNGTTNIAAGKTVKDLDATVEASLIAAGYTKKIAGQEYTVTWKNHAGTVLKTEKVESGKVPVWTGGEVNVSDAGATRRHNGWCTAAWNGGTSYVFPTALPAIAASDVTYFAHYQALYAEVISGSVDSLFTSAQGAWAYAMTKTQATIKILSNLGTEASVGNMTQMVFNPSNANSIITLDLNGHSWTMGNHATASENKDVFLNVSPSKANCKLIVTDNSASGNGYLMNKQSLSTNLLCAYVAAGELLLQGGALKASNAHATCNAVGVQASGTGVFNMTGGLVESKKEGDAVTGGTASGVYAYSATNLSGGTIKATNTKAQAIGVHMMRNTFTTYLSDDVHVITNGSQSYGVYGYGTVEVSGGTYDVTAEKVSPATWSTARGVYMTQSSSTYFGKATIKGNPVFNVTGVSGAAYGVYSYNHANVESVVEGGTFNVKTTGAGSSWGVTAHDQATTTVKGGTFNVSITDAAYEGCFGAYAQTNGIVNVEGGTFTVTPAKVGGNNDCARITSGDDTQLNISGGTFTSENCAYGVRCFNGTTRISGNPVFSARNGIDVATWAQLSGNHTATAIVDGGTFIATAGSAIRSNKNERTVDAVAYNVYGDLTIWDGKFYSGSNQPVDASSGTSYLKIRGGYYSTYIPSNVSNLNKYVISPSTTEKKDTTINGKAYTYRVNTKYNVTWSVNGNTTVQEYNRNETPSYGSTPVHSGADTYEFIGWSPEIAPVTTDVTYTAQFQKWEAEVIEGEAATGVRFEDFADAWTVAQNLPVAKLKLLSDVGSADQLQFHPDSVEAATTTIDLNNHTLSYTGTSDRFLYTNKTGSKLIITDSSLAAGGMIKYDGTRAGLLICAATHYGDLELQGGTIYAKNGHATQYAVGVYPCRATTFTMTGGAVKAYSKTAVKGIYSESGSTAIINISGGEVLGSAEYATDTWGTDAYGIYATSGSKFTISGTASVTAHANQDARGVYATGVSGNISEVTIKGGSVNAIVNTKRTFGAYAEAYGKINIEGGTVDGHSTVADVTSMWNVEGAHCSGNGILNISGGTITSSNGASHIGVHAVGGTTTITGGTISSRTALYAVDYATATQTAIVNVFGGTFIGTSNAVYVEGKIRGDIKNNANVTINGGYFYSEGSRIVHLNNESGANASTLVLNGGKYCEKSGTTFKTQISNYKGGSTTITDINETVGGKTYKYELSTPFAIHWRGGDSYTKDESVLCGVMPSNTELDGKSYVRNDSSFYFTGWNPTPTYVTGETTYQAVGDYYEAEVKIGSGAWKRYTDFLEAWDTVQVNANCTLRLLSNLTLTDKIIYRPEVANARLTFDLNNFTLNGGGTTDRLLEFNKADAILTITDNSSAKGGKISLVRTSTSTIYTVCVHNGELKMTGGKIYSQNNQDDDVWHPAIGVYISNSGAGKLTMTGGTIESQAAYLAYAIYNYGTTIISGGTIRANATATGNALGLYAVDGTATVSGGTFNITASQAAFGASATGYINNTGSISRNGTLNITGGTFNISATNKNVCGIQVNGTGKEISGTIYKAHGIANISGGTFNISCSAATATQVFGAQVNAWRLFDDALPHTLRAEEKGELNISGGTFTVDARNSGAWVQNEGNVDMLRCWGILNVSGGNFTIYQYNNPYAICTYRGKSTISGNPVFNVYSHANNAYGVGAGVWTHENYCDKNAANNLAEVEVNGGTFKIITEGANTNGVNASGMVSAETRDGETITAHAGYAMNAKITVNGGTFLTICPNASGKYPIVFNCADDRVGTYGTAISKLYVNGGRFKSRKGTEADNTSTGAVNAHTTGTIWLTGGYYETNGQLSARVADTCLVTTLTSAEMDPEYANGYRYRIDVDYQAKVTVGAVERKFALFRDAFDYAKTQNNATITLLRNINYEGLNFMYNPSSVRSCTLDLNGFTFTGAVSGHTGGEAYNNDRLLIINKAGATFTIKDSSVGKTGKWSHEKAGAGFSVIVYHGKFVLQSGTVHGKNTSGNVQAVRTENYADALVSITGGKAHAEASGTAYGMSTYNKATISGGEIIAESSAGEAYGVWSNAAEDTTIISGGRITASGTNGYGVRSSSVMTISGGKIIGESINTTGAAYGVSVAQSTTTINGVDSIYAHATKNAYGVYSAGTGVATINGGKIISRNGDSNGASITTYAINSGTININNGTFYAQRDGAGTSNIQTARTGNNATMTIIGGTFHAEGYQAVNARGGTTNISGGTFYAMTGICAMDWADATTITANVSVTGGTFDCTGVCLYVRSNNSNNATPSRNGHSEVTVSGGKFKTTGSTIAQLIQVDGTDPSTLTITGGYFNEKSGTTHKDQIANFVSNPYEVFTLETGDPEIANGYSYEVCQKRVAKVTESDGKRTYYTDVKAALDYFKTKNNATLTMLKDDSYTGRYTLTPTISNWRGTWDLNDKVVTCTSSTYGMFDLNKADAILTITDNSVGKGGRIEHVESAASTAVWGINIEQGEIVLHAGTISANNTQAGASSTKVGISVKNANSRVTMTGGRVEAIGTSSTYGFNITGGTVSISGGSIEAKSEYPSGTYGDNAYGIYLAAGSTGTSNVTISGSPTIDVTANRNAYGISNNIAGATDNISGGTFTVTAHTNSAYGVYNIAASTINVSNASFAVDASTGQEAYGLYAKYTNAKIVTENTTYDVSAKTTIAYALAAYNSANIEAKSGTFTATSDGTKADGLHIESSATATIKNGTFTMTSNGDNAYAIEAQANPGAITIEGGTFTSTTKTNAGTSYWNIEGVRIWGGCPSTVINISGGTFSATNNSKAPTAAYAIRTFSGTINISGNPTFSGQYALSVADQYVSNHTAYVNISGGTFTGVRTCIFAKQFTSGDNVNKADVTITGGKFKCGAGFGMFEATNTSNLKLQGGYYSKNTPTLETYCVAPKHAIATTAADKSVVGNDYNWKVVDAYTLTWTTDGDALTGTYTNGMTAVGASITAPNTPTKTGYTFASWSPAVAATMPAANTEYTATWTCVSPTSLSIASTGNKWDFCNGETMTLTVSGTNIAANATYQWQLGGVNIAGATSATYTTTMAAAKAGAYTCTVTNGSCSTTTGDYYVRVWQLYINNGTADAWQALDFANTGTNTGSNTTVALTSDKSYQFKLKDNTGGWFGLNSKTVTKTESAFALNGTGADVNVTSGMAGNYTFAINYSDKNNPTVAITYPTANQPANRNIYFDKSVIAGWGADIYYRIGKPSHNTNNSETGGTAWTLVPGTDNFYTTKTMAYDGFEAWQIANNKSWSGDNSIYKVDGAGYAITKATNFQKYVVGESGVTIVPTTSNNTENGCNYWNVAVTDGMLTHTATITTPTNGTITIANAAQSLSATATTAGLPHRTILTITATPAPGYALSTLTVNGAAFTSGNTFVLAADATIAATFEATDIGFYADIVDVDNTNSKLIVNVTSWAANGWPYSINGVAYDKGARETDRTLKVACTGAPGDDFGMLIQKTGGEVVSYHTYVIPQEVKSATTISANQTKNIFVKGTTLTVNANITAKNIYVAPDAKLVVNSGKTLTADTIFLRTTTASAGELDNKGTIASSTKAVYTRIIKDKDFHLFGLPLSCPVSSVRLSDGVVPAYTTGWVLRSYDEARRADYGADDNNWTTLAAGGTIAGGAGYEMFSASNYYREFYFPVNLAELTNKVAVTYHLGTQGEKQAGWNAIASPFTKTYANEKVPEGLVVNWYQDGYGYYEQEIPTAIPPAKPFAIQATKNGYITFDGSSIAALVPRRRAAAQEEVQIQWIELEMTDMNGLGDQTNVYSHPDRYDAVYQTGIDIAKQSLTAARAIIYSSHAYGEMAFAGVADSLLEQGVALTVYSPKPQELSISMRDNAWLDRLAEVWLIDMQNGAQIDLFNSDYTFEAEEGTTRGRLFIQGRFKAPQIATDNESVESESLEFRGAEKLIIRDKLYIRINGQLYDATGKQVNGK